MYYEFLSHLTNSPIFHADISLLPVNIKKYFVGVLTER